MVIDIRESLWQKRTEASQNKRGVRLRQRNGEQAGIACISQLLCIVCGILFFIKSNLSQQKRDTNNKIQVTVTVAEAPKNHNAPRVVSLLISLRISPRLMKKIIHVNIKLYEDIELLLLNKLIIYLYIINYTFNQLPNLEQIRTLTDHWPPRILKFSYGKRFVHREN